jgi:hypothetical protein
MSTRAKTRGRSVAVQATLRPAFAVIGRLGIAAGAILQGPHARDEMRPKPPIVKPGFGLLSPF